MRRSGIHHPKTTVRRALLALGLVVALPVIAAEAMTVASLGLDASQMQGSLFGAVRGGYFAPTIPSALRAMPADQKREAVKVMGAFAKDYFGSSDFKKSYGKAYKDQNPTHFGMPSVSMSSVTKAATDKATGADKKNDAWKLDKDPKVQLRNHLEMFLSATADVDFAAATHMSGGTKLFDKPEYESKPREWKMCFRAGQDVTEEVRAFARSWADELKK